MLTGNLAELVELETERSNLARSKVFADALRARGLKFNESQPAESTTPAVDFVEPSLGQSDNFLAPASFLLAKHSRRRARVVSPRPALSLEDRDRLDKHSEAALLQFCAKPSQDYDEFMAAISTTFSLSAWYAITIMSP
jgi:hypothetical protein